MTTPSRISSSWPKDSDSKALRDMRIVLTLLGLNFLLPSLSYFFAPDLALSQFRALGALLGGPPYPLPEESYLWRVLASGNVFTLAFLCFLLQVDLRRFYGAVPVFVVLKGYSALGYLYVFLFQLPYRLFLAVFLWDGLAVFLVVSFCARAHRSLRGRSAP